MSEEKKRICVFLGSHDPTCHVFEHASQTLGRLIGEDGYDLVFGGDNFGMMGNLAGAAESYGAKLHSIISRQLGDYTRRGSDYTYSAETTEKQTEVMIKFADAFIALPGGIETLDQIITVLLKKSRGEIDQPIIICNVDGFWDWLRHQLAQMVSFKLFPLDREKTLAHPKWMEFYKMYAYANTVENTMDYINNRLEGT